MSAPRDDRGGRAHDPERIADVCEQLEAGSFRFTGENPANSENDYARCTAGCWEASDGTFMRTQKVFMGEGPLPCPDCNGTGRGAADS